ncbi:MAG TPA: tetratricopeptide repeat protein [Acidobacteriota bacterium]
MSAKPFRRKDLKHDELITVTGRAGRWLMQRRRRIGWAVLVVVVLLSVVFSVRFAQQRQEQRAAALLAAAMEVYRAPVVAAEPAPPAAAVDPAAATDPTAVTDPAAATDPATVTDPAAAGSGSGDPGEASPEAVSAEPPPPAQPTGLQFATSEEKFRAARERFQPIVERYGGRPSGRIAAFYLGICEFELGDMAAASEALGKAASASEELISAMALYRLGQLELGAGNAEAAIQAFDRLLAADSNLFPRDEALMAKARAHEQAGDPRTALATYQRILDVHADSQSAVEARTRVEELSAQLGLDPNVNGD